MKNIYGVLLFVAGAGAGVAGSFIFFKNKYKKISDKEIADVKEAFSKMKASNTFEVVSPVITKEDAETIIERVNYASKSSSKGKAKSKTKGPYIIPPEQFGDHDDYQEIGLTYYTGDKILIGEKGERIEDFADMIGKNTLHDALINPATGPVDDDDAIYIRNDLKKCDYEIIIVNSKYYNQKTNYNTRGD